ncbi:CD209 antigen-like protein E [Gymnodraco acuticeps]|uniref:CD209 antigen-like protein E n=1 Tax=Gymnodraco acuticeps TaxID=8218 RepID=A0A6P8SSV2_GYMAC|nr:CD209 antigen-like protein E [Gymnodraco acuticeps]
MDEVYANADDVKSLRTRLSTIQEVPRRFLRASVLGLGLLSVFLLAGLIGLAVHYHNSVGGAAANLSSVTEERDNLTDRLQANDQLINQLKANLTEKTREVDRLQCFQKPCPAGWRKFGCSCYLLSTEKASWQQSRQNCRARRADLVIVDSFEEQIFLESMIKKSQINSSMIYEQEFIDRIYENTWIGLNDTEKEGTWKWVDGSPLNLTNQNLFWSTGQPDNGGGKLEEDCVYINPSTWWEDLPCWRNLHWICEKKA